MKATGEVMSICDSFEGALMKAIRSLEQHVDSLLSYDFTALSVEELKSRLKVVDDQRIWVIAEASNSMPCPMRIGPEPKTSTFFLGFSAPLFSILASGRPTGWWRPVPQNLLPPRPIIIPPMEEKAKDLEGILRSSWPKV